jgi:nitric oxide reductase activation protein
MINHKKPPALSLDWEEGLFRALRGLWRRLAPAPAAPQHPQAAPLDPHLPRLAALAKLATGAPLELQRSSGDGEVCGLIVRLPAQLWLCKDLALNQDAWTVRLLIDAQMAAMGARAPQEADAHARALHTLWWAAQALAALSAAWPSFDARYAAAAALALAPRPPPDALQGRARALERRRQALLAAPAPFDLDAEARALAALPGRGPDSPRCSLWGEVLPSGAPPPGAPGAPPDGAHPSGPERSSPRELLEVRHSKLKEEENYNPLLHTFEKVETLDEHRGGYRQADGADDLDEHLEALEEVDLREVFRGGPPAESILKAQLPLLAEIPDVESIALQEPFLTYPEWDHRRRAYKPDWCKVYPTALPAQEPAWGAAAAARHARLIERLWRRLDHHRSLLVAQRRQLDGEEIDLDAAIRAACDRAAGEEGDPRLYVRRARQRREVALTVLLDISLSTDSWVEDQRVLDVSREALVVLGEVSERLGDPLSILAFASKTRNVCRVFEVCGWRERWALGRARLGALKPQGYTRIGPALRHAVAMTRAVAARRHAVILLSDGKPTDFDRYEGAYGVEDLRAARREAAAQGVLLHALTIDSHARPALSAAFGDGQWTLLRHPGALPEALTGLYGRISAP